MSISARIMDGSKHIRGVGAGAEAAGEDGL